MKISKEEVGHVAHLARLNFSEEEKETYTSQLNEILMYMDILNKIDTSDVAPMTHAISLTNALRDDVKRKSLGTDRALANAPEEAGDFFKVPRVID
ncbi:MAG: Asp-tRNA(Asn)/Glu-tRNA(Gln) amidotransferase subunit GatC [Deltaproteobacteria bacterium]|nr:Asp-tRNA(Asn)/Glu-tRNA(Gln) amidotransferase subunit GatC [Deltaproteobacteria bacterium]MBN2846211.1 Asp-tRNA(Asn)/Glu-tRNA(Gln) amidotransferase subunit GatC [Deltaproteobacteria bacterium]